MISLCLYFLCRPVSKNLFAGGGAGETSSIGGIFNFSMDSLLTRTAWSIGSAYNLSIDILYV